MMKRDLAAYSLMHTKRKERSSGVVLSPLAKHVRRTRGAFLRSLHNLPPVASINTRAHVHERAGRIAKHAKPLIGEYAPWLAADLLGVKNSNAIQKVATAWLHLYFFTLNLDDLIDGNSGQQTHIDYISSCLLLQRGISALVSQSNRDSDLIAVIDLAFARTAGAAIQELENHRDQITPYSAKDISSLGNKIGLLAVCATAVGQLRVTAKSNLQTVKRAFHRLATAIQLLDDLTDWEEDLEMRNHTLPLTIERLRCSETHSYPKREEPRKHDEVFLSMVKSRAVEDTLAFAIRSLTSALKCIEAIVKSNGYGVLTKRYVEQIRKDATYAKRVVRQCRIEINRAASEVPAPELLDESEIAEQLDCARSALHVVAQKT